MLKFVVGLILLMSLPAVSVAEEPAAASGSRATRRCRARSSTGSTRSASGLARSRQARGRRADRGTNTCGIATRIPAMESSESLTACTGEEAVHAGFFCFHVGDELGCLSWLYF